ncbi:MAG: hypothetical protein JWN39_404 [Ilumatobacteraceae bacterium]|nr:hypothetical protein [Ilumatobacteraceae bacterium]
MSKAKKAARAARAPGPIAVWRLPLAVVVSGCLTGHTLIDAATSGQHIDLAMGRSFGAACVVWFAAGRVNRVFVDADLRVRETGPDTSSGEGSVTEAPDPAGLLRD